MRTAILLAGLLLAACGSSELPAPAVRAPHLVDADWLRAHRAEVVVVDMSSKEAYEKGRVSGALHVTVDELRAGDLKDLPPRAELERRLGRLGIDENTHVVVYDDMRGRNAAWLWFVLEQVGHGAVSLLEGGTGGLETESGPAPPVEPARYQARRDPPAIVEADYVQARLGKALLVDARPAAQYTGEKPKSGMKGGHVPGARNVPYTAFLAEDGRYLGPEAARAMLAGIFGRLPATDEEIILYCNTYHEASNVHFQLARLGYTNLKAYDGSMADWEARGLPLAKGDRP